MQSEQRLLGIDLGRGIAAYAVILVHSGDSTWGLPVEVSAELFRSCFYFSVPFFLAVSFYFLALRLEAGFDSAEAMTPAATVFSPPFPHSYWQQKLGRIAKPYLIWSVVYVLVRSINFAVTWKPARLHQMLQDPLSMLFFGAASYHLYFLPMLLSGMVLAFIGYCLQCQKLNLATLFGLMLVSLAVYEWLFWSGNEFFLGDYTATAFRSALAGAPQTMWMDAARLFWVPLAWAITCLPYWAIAMVISRLSHPNALIFKTGYWWLVCFIVLSVAGDRIFPTAIDQVLIAFSMLLAAIGFSSYLQPYRQLLINLGNCSFGIYLIHPLVMNIYKPLVAKLLPSVLSEVSIGSILLLSMGCFCLSWAAIAAILPQKHLSKHLF